MATAGIPAMAKPWMPRSTNNTSYEGASANNNPTPAATTTAVTKTSRRPTTSEIIAAGSTPSASAPVATLTDQEAEPGSSPHSEANCGSNGCVT